MTEPDDVFPLRPDLKKAHRRAWLRIARPGTWWTGAQRVAMARQSRLGRDCPECRHRDSEGGESLHSTRELPAAAVELVHTAAAVPWRINREWAEKMIDALGDAPYVEAVAVTATTVNLDVFRRAVGLPLLALPPAEPGAPTRTRPERLSSRAGWVAMARRGEMQPDPFQGAWTPNICLALSLVPEETAAMRDLIEAEYIPFQQVGNLKWPPRPGLTRPQMEWLAMRVSAANQCFY